MEVEKVINERRKLNDMYNEFQDARVVEMRLRVDNKGEVYVEYAKYYKKTI
jgi:hypothetical protein